MPGGVVLDGPNAYISGVESLYGPNGYVIVELRGRAVHETYCAPDGSVLAEFDIPGGMKTLRRPELEGVRDALLSGYNRWNDLDELAAFALDIDLEVEVGQGALRTVAFDLLKFTEARGWTEALLRQAVARRSGNPDLQAISRGLGLAPAPFAGRNAGYEARVLQHSGLTSLAAGRDVKSSASARCARSAARPRAASMSMSRWVPDSSSREPE